MILPPIESSYLERCIRTYGFASIAHAMLLQQSTPGPLSTLMVRRCCCIAIVLMQMEAHLWLVMQILLDYCRW